MCSWMAVHTLPRRAPGDQLSYHLVRGRGAMLSCCAITASCEVKKGHPAANAKFLLSGCVWCSQIQMEDATLLSCGERASHGVTANLLSES